MPGPHDLGVHVGAENGVNPGLVAPVAAKPLQEIRVEAHGNGSLGAGHNNLGLGPECLVRRIDLRVLRDGRVDLRVRFGEKALPACARFSRLPPRVFASRCAAHAVPISMLI